MTNVHDASDSGMTVSMLAPITAKAGLQASRDSVGCLEPPLGSATRSLDMSARHAHPALPDDARIDSSSLLDGRHTQHKRIVRNVPPHHCSRANKGIPPNRRATDNGGIGTNGRPASHQSARILIVTHDLRPWVNDIRKDTRRSTEDIVFEFHPV